MSHQGYSGPHPLPMPAMARVSDDCQNEHKRIVPRRIHESEPNPKQAYGDRKVPLATFPSAGLIYGALATAEGARKYGSYNWRDKPVELMTYAHAVLRHLMAWIDGEDDDPESGKPHIGHGIACLAIMADAIETNNAINNRPAKGSAAALLQRYERPPPTPPATA